jgi:hypothetical protein
MRIMPWIQCGVGSHPALGMVGFLLMIDYELTNFHGNVEIAEIV